ncbi:MAG: class I SAM-dependent methyltransferase [Elusimicrobia bacterium]|nr:class I SAM-dependent methyltransferase [Elusimicrobiota bacterium]
MKNKNVNCSFCNSDNMSLIIDFGDVALAGGFLREDQFPVEKKYPLQLYFCRECYSLQVVNKISPEILFKNYFYFSSAIGTLKEHFIKYAEEVTDRFLVPGKSTVLEIGCNDGVLLNPFSKRGIKTVIGVDPSENVVKSISNPHIIVVNDFFSEKVAAKILGKYGQVDLIAANNVFAHLYDIHDIVRGIKKLLSKDGVFVFEVHYIANLIDEIQYDMIYHEHLYYYSLIALENLFSIYDMEIFDVKKIPIHAGSMRYYVRKKGGLKKEKISEDAIRLKKEELRKKYDKVETYLDYAQRVKNTKTTLINLIRKLKKEDKVIYGYGASGRANTVIQYCDIDKNMLDCIIDDAPAKQGFYTPGSHFLIKSREFMELHPPDYILVFAWSFVNEIIKRNQNYLNNGGKIIIPLPEVKIISSKDGKINEESI